MKSRPLFLSLAPMSIFCAATSVSLNAAPLAKPVSAKAKTEKIDPVKAQKMADRVLRETSVLRELPVKHSIKTKVMTRSQVEKMLAGMIAGEQTNRQILASELFLRQLDLAPANFQLKQTYIQMMGEQIAGFYAAKTNTFTTTDRTNPLQLETIMAHELTHALQDQHFDLSRLENWPQHDGDAKLAVSALAEGDATLVMTQYMAKNPIRFLGTLMGSIGSQASSPAFEAAPRMLRDSVKFPYVNGMMFVQRLQSLKGWEGVGRAYKDLPKSTEQIIHFEKYTQREEPQRVAIHDLSKSLGTGWKMLDYDVNGEFGLFLVLVDHLNSEDAAWKAAGGWGGDRYYVYSGPRTARLVVQDTRWDSLADASEWRNAYVQSATNRMGAKPAQRGSRVISSSGKKGIWIEQRGARVLILEGTVGAFNIDTLFTSLWRGSETSSRS